MSIAVPLYGFSGSGKKDRLKLRVLGGMTAPANPQENDIWVQTDVAISGWEFSETQNPTWAMGAGFVYFTSTYSGAYDARDSTGLNFLNQNAIYTKLLSCNQYNGSSWSKKDAWIRHGSQWYQFSAEFAATINITYPAGSTCTVTNGSVTYTAPDTSGTWACVVHATGTWTVMSTNGTQTATASVSITADGQTQSATLQYFSARINISYPAGSSCKVIFGDTTQWAPDTSGYWACTVFATGTYVIQSFSGSLIASQNVSITYSGQSVSATLSYVYYVFGGSGNYTGGWTALGNVTSVGSEIKCYVDWSWAGCQVFSNGAFSLSGFTTLNVSVSAVSAIRDQASFGVSSGKPNTTMWNDSFTNKNNCAAIKSITSTGVYTLDISSLSGNYYFWTGQNGTGWSGSSGFTIDKIWLS